MLWRLCNKMAHHWHDKKMNYTLHGLDGLGAVKYDIGYGGAFYALVDVQQLNMDLTDTPAQKLEQTGTAISEAIRLATCVKLN